MANFLLDLVVLCQQADLSVIECRGLGRYLRVEGGLHGVDQGGLGGKVHLEFGDQLGLGFDGGRHLIGKGGLGGYLGVDHRTDCCDEVRVEIRTGDLGIELGVQVYAPCQERQNHTEGR